MTEAQQKSYHKLSSEHRNSILQSSRCGCFCCMKFFKPAQIKEWIDAGQTALCYWCGIDSVLCDKDVPKLNKKLLKEMEAYWFSVKDFIK